MPLDEGPEPRKIKLWFSLCDITLEGKQIGPDPKRRKKLNGELMLMRS
jgi:hypothetical protein